MGLLSANALMGPLSLLGAGVCGPVPAGRCAGLVASAFVPVIFLVSKVTRER